MNLTVDNTLVLLVDVQEKLFPHIKDNESLKKRMEILLEGVLKLELPLIVNEQYKKGLGETIAPLKNLLEEYKPFEKVTFSCCKNEDTLSEIERSNKEYVVVFGIETHICVLQTILDLRRKGYKPVVVTDCVGSRKDLDTQMALERMIQLGVIPTTYESFLFEILASAKHEKFKEISKLIK